MLAGFQGHNCDVNIDDCASLPCYNSGVCMDDENAYSCVCSSGFAGLDCSTVDNGTLNLMQNMTMVTLILDVELESIANITAFKLLVAKDLATILVINR